MTASENGKLNIHIESFRILKVKMFGTLKKRKCLWGKRKLASVSVMAHYEIFKAKMNWATEFSLFFFFCTCYKVIVFPGGRNNKCVIMCYVCERISTFAH